MGLMGTLAALLLSLQLGTAKSSFDTLNTELLQVSANPVLFDPVFYVLSLWLVVPAYLRLCPAIQRDGEL